MSQTKSTWEETSAWARSLPRYAQLLARTDAPPGSAWGVFGPDDELGTLNFLQLNPLAQAASLVRAGEAYRLDVPSDVIAPSLAPTRRPAEHHIFQRTPWHRDDYLDAFYPQFGSQIDGLRHIGHPDHGFYNRADPAMFTPGGGRLSVHRLAMAPIAGRAVLLDVARHMASAGRPVDHAGGQPIFLSDLRQTCEAQGVALQPGDILLLRFGWLEWYQRQDAATRSALAARQVHPGLDQSHDILEWLWDHRISLAAADNFALERWPASEHSPFFTAAEARLPAARRADPHAGVMHRALIALLGMPIGELWNLDALASACAADRRWTFLLTAAAIPLVGGVGSPANAIALR